MAQSRIDEQKHLLDKATAELAEFDSLPAMMQYEAQRQQIYKQALPDLDSELRRLDALHNELLKARSDLLAQRVRAELALKELQPD